MQQKHQVAVKCTSKQAGDIYTPGLIVKRLGCRSRMGEGVRLRRFDIMPTLCNGGLVGFSRTLEPVS